MAEKYYTILTNRGKELEAQSSATGKPVIIKDFVVGDGNGQAVKPDPALTSLVHEVYRAEISALQVSPDQANQFIAQLVLPADVGGFVVREVGLLTDAGELYAVANCAAIEKPVSGISVRLQFRLAVSETADIELKVSTGDGLFLRQDANLGDVKDVAESRKNIGLKGAAVLDVGTTENTVAAGDDNRIVNALQKENNLSDVEDKPQARVNLELKSAATADVQTSRDDVTPGRVLVNGGALALRTVAAGADREIKDASGLPANSVSFCYASAAFSPGYEATILDVGGLGGDGYRVQYAASYADGGKRLKFRTLNADNGYWGGWTNVLTQYGGNVDYLDGASYYKTNPADWPGVGAFAHQYSNPVAPFTIPFGRSTPKGVSQYLPIIKGISSTQEYGFGSAVSFGILRTGNNDFGSAVVHIIGDNGSGAVYQFDANGVFNAPGQVYSGGIIGAAGDIRSNGGSLYAAGQVSVGGNVVAGSGVYESGGYVRVYSTNNPPPRDQYAAPNTAGFNGAALWWRCGSTGKMTMAAQVGGIPNGGRVYFPTAFANVCASVVPTRNEEPGNGAAMQPYNVDATGFNLRVAGGGTVTLMYVAEGY